MPARTCGITSVVLVDHHVDLPGHQILHGRRDAAIGHEVKARAGHLLEMDAVYMPDRPTPDVPIKALSGFDFSQAMKPLRSSAGMTFLATISLRRAGEPSRSGAKAVRNVVRQIEGGAIDHVGAPVPLTSV